MALLRVSAAHDPADPLSNRMPFLGCRDRTRFLKVTCLAFQESVPCPGLFVPGRTQIGAATGSHRSVDLTDRRGGSPVASTPPYPLELHFPGHVGHPSPVDESIMGVVPAADQVRRD